MLFYQFLHLSLLIISLLVEQFGFDTCQILCHLTTLLMYTSLLLSLNLPMVRSMSETFLMLFNVVTYLYVSWSGSNKKFKLCTNLVACLCCVCVCCCCLFFFFENFLERSMNMCTTIVELVVPLVLKKLISSTRSFIPLDSIRPTWPLYFVQVESTLLNVHVCNVLFFSRT